MPKMSPEEIVEDHGCGYHIGTAVRALLEHATHDTLKDEDLAREGSDQLRTALHHVMRQLVCNGAWLGPSEAGHRYAADVQLEAIARELPLLPHKEIVLALRGLLVGAVLHTLEDVLGQA